MVRRSSWAVGVRRWLWTAFTLIPACGAGDAESGGEAWEDAGAPVVLESVPAAGDMEVDASLTELTVIFSEPMEVSGYSWVTELGHSVPSVSGFPFYADETTAVLPVYLEPDTSYAVWVNSPSDSSLRKFANEDGVAARAYRINFHTR